MKKRFKESRTYFKFTFIVSFMFGINTIVPTMAAISTFATMSKLDMPLPTPEQMFLLIAVWNVLAAQIRIVPVGLGSFANIKATLTRVFEFLNQEELIPYVRSLPIDSDFNAKFTNASLGWNTEPDSVNLVQISLEAKRGETVVIAGPVGSGKSSIFEALTNQMFLQLSFEV